MGSIRNLQKTSSGPSWPEQDFCFSFGWLLSFPRASPRSGFCNKSRTPFFSLWLPPRSPCSTRGCCSGVPAVRLVGYIWIPEPDTLPQLYSTYWWRWPGGQGRVSPLPPPSPPCQQYPQKRRSGQWPSGPDPTRDPVSWWTIRCSARWRYCRWSGRLASGWSTRGPSPNCCPGHWNHYPMTKHWPATTPHLAQPLESGALSGGVAVDHNEVSPAFHWLAPERHKSIRWEGPRSRLLHWLGDWVNVNADHHSAGRADWAADRRVVIPFEPGQVTRLTV